MKPNINLFRTSSVCGINWEYEEINNNNNEMTSAHEPKKMGNVFAVNPISASNESTGIDSELRR